MTQIILTYIYFERKIVKKKKYILHQLINKLFRKIQIYYKTFSQRPVFYFNLRSI